MGVTIKQIAEMAGVHRSTVDKVLHGRPGVSEAVRIRVQKIIDECKYETNPIGKALQMQDKELVIQVLLLEVDAASYLRKGIEEKLRHYASFRIKVDFHITQYAEVEEQEKLLEQCLQECPQGIILSPINDMRIVKKINACMEKGIPVITVNTDIKGSKRLCFIGQDGFKAGRVAARLMGEFLQGQGKVAVFTSDGDNHQSFPFGTREGGFRELMASSYPQMEIMDGIHTQEKQQVIRKSMRQLCENMPDLAGVYITCGGVKAVGDILEEYEQKNIKVICYENYPEILEMLKQGIVTATLDSEIKEQGQKSIEILMDYLIYKKNPIKKHLYSEIKILLKESL